LNKQPRFPNAERNGWGAAVKRFLPYAVFGAVAFSLASASHFHYLLKGYLLVLEIQAALLLVYFLRTK
jgi:F0F1-type ATP synthase assembly protein I